jgi:hypothetical protein
MTSKQEIKDLFSTELRNCSIYQEVLLLKQAILAEIAAPNVNMFMSYNFTTKLTDDEVSTFKMCFLLEFGWIEQNVSTYSVSIDMSKFLQ